jgi:hypothetical protein
LLFVIFLKTSKSIRYYRNMSKNTNSSLLAELENAKKEITALVELHRKTQTRTKEEKAKLEAKLSILQKQLEAQPHTQMPVSEQSDAKDIMQLMEQRVTLLLSVIKDDVEKRTNSLASNHALAPPKAFGSAECGCFSPAMFRSAATTQESETASDMLFEDRVTAMEVTLVTNVENLGRAVTAQAEEFAKCLKAKDARIEGFVLAAETTERGIATASAAMERRLEDLLRSLRDMMLSDSSDATPGDESPAPAPAPANSTAGCFPFTRHSSGLPADLRDVESRLAALVEAATCAAERRLYESHETASQLHNRIEELSQELSVADRTAEVSVLMSAYEVCQQDFANEVAEVEQLRLDLEACKQDQVALQDRNLSLEAQLEAKLSDVVQVPAH